MKSNEERIRLMHLKTHDIQKKRDGLALFASGAICSALFIALFFVAAGFYGQSSVYTDETFTGSSLLSNSVGGYVLVAVIAFMCGAVITVIVKRQKNKKSNVQETRINDEGGKTDESSL